MQRLVRGEAQVPHQEATRCTHSIRCEAQSNTVHAQCFELGHTAENEEVQSFVTVGSTWGHGNTTAFERLVHGGDEEYFFILFGFSFIIFIYFKFNFMIFFKKNYK